MACFWFLLCQLFINGCTQNKAHFQDVKDTDLFKMQPWIFEK